MDIRKRLEEREATILSSFAKLSRESLGRKMPLKLCSLRTDFQRDRDRIIHSKAFRRLSHKTQVFLAPEKDHYRTRLTHTLEVSQISRTIARAIDLNEDLVEAIALGHDLGHTPFGHTGEEALSECLTQISGDFPEAPKSFKHNHQSLRVVDFLEYEGKGLNLTFEVRDGILKHTGEDAPGTLEGEIVSLADRIAYINHDIDDAMRANVITKDDLPGKLTAVLGLHHGTRVNNMVNNMIETSVGSDKVGLSQEFSSAMNELRSFLFERVYVGSLAKEEVPRAKKVVEMLFFHYLNNPDQLPGEFAPEKEEHLPVKICDYVAGMTDRFAIKRFKELFLPKAWMV